MTLDFGEGGLLDSNDEFGFHANRRIDYRQKGMFRSGARKDMILVAKDGSGDYEQIQDAINKTTTTEGDKTIFLKEDTYTITTTITMKSNICLTGSPNAKIKTTANIPIITINGLSNVHVRGIMLEGSTTAGASNHGIYVCGVCNDIFIKDNRIKNVDGNGIYVYRSGTFDTNRVIIQGNWIYHPGIHGIFFHAIGQDIYHCQIQDNSIKLPDDEGIRLEGHIVNDGYVNHTIISGNVVDESTNDGVHLVNANAIQTIVLGNNLINTTGYTDGGLNTEAGHNTV